MIPASRPVLIDDRQVADLVVPHHGDRGGEGRLRLDRERPPGHHVPHEGRYPPVHHLALDELPCAGAVSATRCEEAVEIIAHRAARSR